MCDVTVHNWANMFAFILSMRSFFHMETLLFFFKYKEKNSGK